MGSETPGHRSPSLGREARRGSTPGLRPVGFAIGLAAFLVAALLAFLRPSESAAPAAASPGVAAHASTGPPGAVAPAPDATDAGLAAGPRRDRAPPPAGAEPEKPVVLGTLRVRVTHEGRPVPHARLDAVDVTRRRNDPDLDRLFLFDAVSAYIDGTFAPTTTVPIEAARAWLAGSSPVAADALTSRDGVGSLDLAPGAYRVRTSHDVADGCLLGVADGVVAADAVTELSLPLDFAARVAGVVVDERGRPVAGGLVAAWPADEVVGRRASPRRRTGADGRFELLGFGRVAHVVEVHDAAQHELPMAWSTRPPDDGLAIEVTRVIVPSADLDRAVVPVRWTERTVFEVHGPALVAAAQPFLGVTRTEPGVWTVRGWRIRRLDDHPRGAPLYVTVPDGRGDPWVVFRLEGYEPIVEPRAPGGPRRVDLRRGRVVAGDLTGDEGPPTPLIWVRAFVRRGEDRVEFNGARGPAWTLPDAPCADFDVAAYRRDTRIGPWVTIPAGDADVAGVEVPVGGLR